MRVDPPPSVATAIGPRDGAGGTQPGDWHRVLAGHVVGENLRPEGGADAVRIDEILHAVGYAMQRAERRVAHHRLLGRPRLRHRLVGAQGDETVEDGLQALAAIENRLHYLDRRDLAPGNALAQHSGRHCAQFFVHAHVFRTFQNTAMPFSTPVTLG
jgi:hypothetical protein